MAITCTHTDMMKKDVQPDGDVCKSCIEEGLEWVNLRICMTCGHIGCCETSKGMHAKKHSEETGHPIVKPFKSDEDWTWCYKDRNYIEEA